MKKIFKKNTIKNFKIKLSTSQEKVIVLTTIFPFFNSNIDIPCLFISLFGNFLNMENMDASI